jgi:hypothetical protein
MVIWVLVAGVEGESPGQGGVGVGALPGALATRWEEELYRQ